MNDRRSGRPAHCRHRRRPGRPGRRRPSARPGPAGEALRGRPRGRRESARLGPCPSLHALALLRRRGGDGAAASARAGDCPPAEAFPTGAELVARYLEPLAATPELAAVIETGARVTAISRQGMDKVVSRGREKQPFLLAVASKDGIRRDLARAVIDASGTWTTPNPLGGSGLPAEGEAAFADRIAYGIPDILGRCRDVYAGMTTLVVGAGHSAGNALLELAQLADAEPQTLVPLGDPEHRSGADLWRWRRRSAAGARRAGGGGPRARRERARHAGDRLLHPCAP